MDEKIEPKNMGEEAGKHRPEDYLPREIEIVERMPAWTSICFGILFVCVLIVGTALATKAYLDLKYELKYNCLPKQESTKDLIWPIPMPTETILPTTKP